MNLGNTSYSRIPPQIGSNTPLLHQGSIRTLMKRKYQKIERVSDIMQS